MRKTKATACGAALSLLWGTACAVGQSDAFIVGGDGSDDSMKIFGALQFRYTANFRDEPANSEDDDTLGFSFRRLRIGVQGKVADGKIGYEVEGETFGDEDMFLLDAFMTYSPAEDWRLRAGQFVLAFDRERVVSPVKLLAVDRPSQSYNINPYGAIRTQGLEAQYNDGVNRLTLTLHGGVGSFNGGVADATADIAGTVRFERAVIGDLSPFDFYSSFPGTPQSLLIGGAAHAEEREDDGFGDDGGERYAFTADITYMHDRFSASAAGSMHSAGDLNRTRGATGPAPQHLWGLVGQTAYFVTDEIEPFVRYEWATSSDDQDDLNILTAGFNWYIIGNAFKFTADVNYVFDGLGPSWERVGDGLLIDDDGGQFVLRTQIQVLF